MLNAIKPLALLISTILVTGCGGGSDTVTDNNTQENVTPTTPIPSPKPEPTPEPAPTPEPEPVPMNKGAFIEENGIVVVEMESTNYSGNWQLQEESNASGGAAIEWTGPDLFNEPESGIITIKIKITNPGTYRFDWATQIGEGNSTTEANDSWLKIQADSFYGVKAATAEHTKSIVCPKGINATENACVGDKPEGGGKKGWFKIFRSGGDVSQFTWSAFTSDRDSHAIYADFNQSGTYSVLISGRSKHHVLDRFIMTKDPTMHNAAKNFDESKREIE